MKFIRSGKKYVEGNAEDHFETKLKEKDTITIAVDFDENTVR